MGGFSSQFTENGWRGEEGAAEKAPAGRGSQGCCGVAQPVSFSRQWVLLHCGVGRRGAVCVLAPDQALPVMALAAETGGDTAGSYGPGSGGGSEGW